MLLKIKLTTVLKKDIKKLFKLVTEVKDKKEIKIDIAKPCDWLLRFRGTLVATMFSLDRYFLVTLLASFGLVNFANIN